MAVLAQCAQCKRKGGYAEKAEDKLCARCKAKHRAKPKEDTIKIDQQ